MVKVIFDSSFLIAVAEKATTWQKDIADALGGNQPVLLECVSAELRSLAKRGGRRGRYASLALTLASGFASEKCSSGDVDSEIVSKALTHLAVVATADRELRRTLMARGVRVIGFRGGRVALF